MADEERDARRGLACVLEAGDARAAELLRKLGPIDAWRVLTTTKAASPWADRARAVDLDAIRRAEDRAGIRFVIPDDDEWPAGLRTLAGCPPVQRMAGQPIGLWARGRALGALLASSVAMVGSRASSPYGERVAADLAAGVGASGYTVVSGAAYGIDAAAHRGALAEGGPSVAFVAGGIDEPYPRAHEALLAELGRTGAVVSEYPPGEHPTRRRFLARNRLIAAATVGTVIVEASVRSGARNTVSWASACGRPVMAVPGPVSSAQSFTPHQLIRDREAVLVTRHEEIVELLSPVGTGLAPRRPRRERLLDGLDAAQRAVYEALPSRGRRPTDELSLRAGLGVRDTLAALSRLSTQGLAEATEDGCWRIGEVRDRPLPEPPAEEAR
ncbi:DNA-processing protein DprA [Nigerium massiliense]|uniref:DNA-processing protein DprA n=1 Tax=Nigerium massiliense TaxID=1522317 RepID=UPI0006941D04|nr:DNA-processing protein DprA [Nigerium massiliense]